MRYVRLTIKLPEDLWSRLKIAIIERKIKSIQQSVVDALVLYIAEKIDK